MRYIVDVKPSVEKKIRLLIEKGEFPDFNHFANIAIENQIIAETGLNPWAGKKKSEPQPKPPANVEKIEIEKPVIQELLKIPGKIKTLHEPMDKDIIGGPLWGQFYKFLPVKVGLRVLANLSKDNMPFHNKFREKACDIAQIYGEKLGRDDKEKGRKLGYKFSSGFPKLEPKSRKRYMDQYLLYIRPTDGKLDGMLPRLKFINVVEDNGSYKVGITKSGLKFVNLESPVLEKLGYDQPLSEKEINFLLDHISKELASEKDHIDALLKFLNEGMTSREDINNKMAGFYEKYQVEGNPWTDRTVNTMRSGLISRLFEFGFIEKKKKGLTVRYGLTEKGKKYFTNSKT